MKLKNIGIAAAIALLSSGITFANQNHDTNALYVQASSYIGPQSNEDQRLVSELIKQIQTDGKLSGQLELTSRNGSVAISGRVDEVTMIYRVVEIVKRNSSVKNIDVRQLDT